VTGGGEKLRKRESVAIYRTAMSEGPKKKSWTDCKGKKGKKQNDLKKKLEW